MWKTINQCLSSGLEDELAKYSPYNSLGVSVHCYWTITVPEGSFVKIVFENLAFTGYNEDKCVYEGKNRIH